MELQEILNKHREYYLEKFSNYVNSIDDPIIELLIEMPYEEPEEIFRLFRYDLATKGKEAPNLKEFNADGYLNHQELNFSVNGKTIILAPIGWNGVDITLDNHSTDISNIVVWATKWLDSKDEKVQDSNKLQGVIHNISKPEKEDDKTTFSVDFGSAPTEAVLELLDILSKDSKATNIKLDSTWMTQ